MFQSGRARWGVQVRLFPSTPKVDRHVASPTAASGPTDRCNRPKHVGVTIDDASKSFRCFVRRGSGFCHGRACYDGHKVSSWKRAWGDLATGLQGWGMIG